jgi:outer membrane protein assembly complex protein YaeT
VRINSVLRISGFVLAALALLVGIGILLLHTPPVKQYALDRIRGLLRDRNIDFNASQLTYNLLDLSVALSDVVVRSGDAPQLPPFARIAHVRAEVSLRELLGGRYVIEDVVARGPSIHFVIGEDGRNNVPRPPQGGGGGTDVFIDRFDAASGSLIAEDRRNAVSVRLPAWRAALDGNPVTRDYDVRFETERPGSAVFQNRTLPVTGLSAHAAIKGQAVAIDVVRLNAADSTVIVAGDIRLDRQTELQLNANARLGLESLLDFAGIERAVSGELNIRAAATGPLPALKVNADIQGDNLAVRQLDHVDVLAQVSYDLAGQRLRVPAFSVAAPAGRLDGEADVALTAAAGTSSAAATLRAVDLLAVTRALVLPFRVASRATGSVGLQWPNLEIAGGDGAARLRLDATRASPAEDVLPVSAALTARVRRGAVSAELHAVEVLRSAWRGNVTLGQDLRLGGRVQGALPDTGATVAAVEQFLGRDLVETGIAGVSQVTAQLAGTLRAPAISAQFEAPALGIGQLDKLAVTADIHYGPRGLRIRKARLRGAAEEITLSGEIGAAPRGPAPLSLSAQVSNTPLSTALSLAGLSGVPVTGSVNARATVGGTTAAPRVDATATVSDVVAYGEPIGTLTAQAQVRGPEITVAPLRLEKPPAGVIQGSADFNTRTGAYRFRLRGNDFELTKVAGGLLDLTAEGSGTVSDPAATAAVDARRLRWQAQPIGDITAKVKLANQVADVTVQAPTYNLNAAARIGINRPWPSEFEIDLAGTNFAVLPVTPRLEGSATASVKGSVPLASWRQGDVVARIANVELLWKGQRIRNFDPLTVRYDRGVVRFEPGAIQAGGAHIFLSGSLPLEKAASPGALQVQAYAPLESLLALAGPQQPVTVCGVLTLDATLRGSLEAIDPTANLTLRDGCFDIPQLQPPVGNITLTAQLSNGAVRIDRFSAQWASAAITAAGDVPLGVLPGDLPVQVPRQSGPMRLTADIKGLNLVDVPMVPSRIGGVISTHLELAAPRLDPAAITARARFDQLELDVAGIRIRQAEPVRLAVENGLAVVEQFVVTGPETRIQVSGTAGLQPPRPLDLRVAADTNASLLSVFTNAVRTVGDTRVEVTIAGNVDAPQINGFVELKDAQVALEQPDIQIQDLSARVELAGERLTIAQLKGLLNGGSLNAGGSIGFGGGRLNSADLRFSGRGVYMNYPDGLKTLSRFDLTFRSRGDELVLGGTASILDGSYDKELTLEGLAGSAGGREIELTGEPDPLLSRIRFDIDVDTRSPLVVDNNLAQVAVTADLDIGGSWYRPGITGRIEIEEGGELYVAERTYLVERGVITLTSEQRLAPSLDIQARTEVSGYDITLRVFGDTDDLETTFTSNPDLPEPDILAVLLTGRTIEEVRGAEVEVAREQILSYFTGRIGGALSREAERALGLSQVRIEPNLIAAESDPSARLTVGQQITRFLNLVYSMDLTDSGDQIWIAEYDVTRRFTMRAIKQEDNSYRMEFRHDLQFGGQPEPRRTRRADRRIGSIVFSGQTVFSEERLLDKLDIDPGNRYDFFKVRKGLENIQELYADASRLEAGVRMERKMAERTVDLRFTVQPGPIVEFVFEGWSVPGDLRSEVRRIWRDGVFDGQRAGESMDAIRGALIGRGYYRSEVKYDISTPEEGRKRVLFEIQPGPRYRGVELVFEGARGIPSRELKSVVKDAGLLAAIHTDQQRAADFLRDYYREQGYLDAQVEPPRYELDDAARSGHVVVPVREGPAYRIGEIRFAGNSAYPDDRLRRAILINRGERYTPELRQQAYTRLQDLYWEKGYRDVDISFRLGKRAGEGRLDLNFQIAEGKQYIVQRIEVAGNDVTSDALARDQVALEPGQPLNNELLSKTRRNLYDLGAYRIVDLETSPVAAADGAAPDRVPVDVRVNVSEIQPYSFRYGAFFDTDRGPGAISDFAARNVLGGARVLGLRTRYDSDLHEARLYFSQPQLRAWPIRSDITGFFRREIRDAFITDRTGITANQETRFGDDYVLSYGYRLERAHTFDREPDPLFPFDITLRVAPFRASLTREKRNDLLDSTMGSFSSHAVEYGTRLFGSQLRFARYFGQYFHYFPLGQPQPIPFSSVRKTRLVFATGVRVGLAGGLGGQELVPSERFFGGGGTTIRGFEQDGVGPQDGRGNALGGNALFIMNNEIRFPVWSMFDGVGFVDLGNVYARLGDFNPFEIRKTAGVGLRLRTPYLLLRLDWGFKLDRKPGESLSRLFFSIGQAF